MHGKRLTDADRLLLKKHAAEKNPADDRIRRIARALLALTRSSPLCDVRAAEYQGDR
jgi:hypothetical protein